MPFSLIATFQERSWCSGHFQKSLMNLFLHFTVNVVIDLRNFLFMQHNIINWSHCSF